MRKHRIIAYMLLAALLLGACSKETISAPKGDPVFGTFVTTDMAGNPVTEQVFSGHKLTMVNIWATFCSPCFGEMSDLGELQAEYGSDLQIIGIVIDAADRNGNVLSNKKAEAKAIIEETNAEYLHILPSPSLNRAYLKNVKSVPETIFLDENGNQVGQCYIGAKSKAEWNKIIRHLISTLP